MTAKNLLGYQEGDSFLYQLSGASKLAFFLLVSIACMTTYDTRLIALVGFLSMALFKLANIKWRQISFVMTFVLVFALLNIAMIYLFAPDYGDKLYGARTVLWAGWGRFALTSQELFYLLNVSLKYFCTVPLAILFLLTTHPSQFASSLNRIGVSYKVAYAVSLTLRYIPDLQEEFQMIKLSQQARGLNLSKKAGLFDKIRGNIRIIMPLIFGSLERIDSISTAMELRRFGRYKKRTWYNDQVFGWKDWLVVGLAVFILLVSVGLFFVNGGRFYNPWS